MHMSSTLLSYWCFFINSSFHHQGRTNVSSVLGVRTPFLCPSNANKTSPPPGRHMPALGFIWRTAIGCRIKGEIYNEVTQLCFVLQIQTMDCISCAMLRAPSSLLKSWGSLGAQHHAELEPQPAAKWRAESPAITAQLLLPWQSRTPREPSAHLHFKKELLIMLLQHEQGNNHVVSAAWQCPGTRRLVMN